MLRCTSSTRETRIRNLRKKLGYLPLEQQMATDRLAFKPPAARVRES